ncbi:DGC domain protein [uncultured archaeon]|nr:DGC domain protein [uncultured archaeon]
MVEEKRCLCSSSDVRVVACCGASNVGQIANQAAIDLAKANVGGFFCLAGVGAHIKGRIKSGKEADDACSKVVEKVKEELAA